MKIQIDISGCAQQQLSALIAAMMAYGSLTPDALADIVAPWNMPKGSAPAPLGFHALSEKIRLDLPNAFPDELNELAACIRAEIQSRNFIPPDDNPSAGVEKATYGSACNDVRRFSNESLTQKFADEVVKPLLDPAVETLKKVDLAAVFGMAAKSPSDADIAGENQQSINEQAALVAPPGVQLDKAGLPWDSRIHAGSKAMVADGTWRQRRNVDPAVVATVEAELRQAMSVPRGGDTHGSPELDADAAKLKALGGDPGPTVGDIVKVDGVTAQLSRQIIPPPPPTVVTPPAPPPAADTGEIDSLPRLLKFITEQKLAGKLNQTQVNQALIAVGIEGPLPVLQARPDLIPTVAGKLRALAGV